MSVETNLPAFEIMSKPHRPEENKLRPAVQMWLIWPYHSAHQDNQAPNTQTIKGIKMFFLCLKESKFITAAIGWFQVLECEDVTLSDGNRSQF